MSTGLANKSTDDALDTRATAAPSLWRRAAGTSALWIGLFDVVLILIFGVISTNGVYLTVASFQNIALAGTELVILAVGFGLLLGSGQFDLSLGANLVLSSVIGAEVISHITGMSATATITHHVLIASLLGLVVCIACGALVGAFNGAVVTFLRVNSLIATLGTTGIATGLALVITNSGDISVPPALQADFGQKTIADIPLIALVAVVVALLAGFLLRYTRTGTRLLAIGSLRTAAVRAGVRVDRFVLLTFVAVGALAGLCGFLDISRFASTSVSGHTLDALNAVAATVIGGTALTGGRMSVLGTVFGALLAVILQTGLVTVGVQSFYQQIAVGAILIVAVAIDQVRRTKREDG